MKRVLGMAMAMAFLAMFPGDIEAASNRCEVIDVDGDRLILECERDNDELKAGDQVKLKTVRTSAPVEGC